MMTLAGIAIDHYCSNCEQDTIVLIQDDEGARVYGETDCCDLTVEMMTVDITEALADCGV